MSTKDPNMKVIIGADTKDFDKGAKDVKQGLKDLSKTGDQAIGSIGKAFGVNTDKVNQMVSAVRGLGAKMTEASSTGVRAFGQLLSSITPLGAAIAGIGISAAVAGFRELKKEADAFKTTVEGANLELATAAYVDTYRQTLRDMGGDVGKSVAEAQSSWKKFWGEFRSVVSDYFTGGGFVNPLGAAANAADTQRFKVAAENAEKAEQLTNQIYDLERKRKEQAVELAKLNDDIATQMNIAKDASASTASRQDAIYKIELMISQKRAMSAGLEEKLTQLYKDRSALATDSVEAADATLEQELRSYEVSRALTQEETALLRIKNSIGKATDAEIDRMNKLLQQEKELQATIDKVRGRWADISAAGAISGSSLSTPGVSGPALTVLPRVDTEYWKETLTAQLGDITIGIGIKADTENIQDISNEINSLLQSGISRTGEILGNLIGTLAGGGDAWGDFKDAALSAFGDMAIAVGKIAIAAGLATEGIQAALKMGNPYVAIAAGAALVALGSAVKSSLSSAASGDYSAGGGGYSSSYSSAGSNGGGYETRDVKVYLTGTLEADGDKLITVINNTNNRNYYTK